MDLEALEVELTAGRSGPRSPTMPLLPAPIEPQPSRLGDQPFHSNILARSLVVLSNSRFVLHPPVVEREEHAL